MSKIETNPKRLKISEPENNDKQRHMQHLQLCLGGELKNALKSRETKRKAERKNRLAFITILMKQFKIFAKQKQHRLSMRGKIKKGLQSYFKKKHAEEDKSYKKEKKKQQQEEKEAQAVILAKQKREQKQQTKQQTNQKFFDAIVKIDVVLHKIQRLEKLNFNTNLLIEEFKSYFSLKPLYNVVVSDHGLFQIACNCLWNCICQLLLRSMEVGVKTVTIKNATRTVNLRQQFLVEGYYKFVNNDTALDSQLEIALKALCDKALCEVDGSSNDVDDKFLGPNILARVKYCIGETVLNTFHRDFNREPSSIETPEKLCFETIVLLQGTENKEKLLSLGGIAAYTNSAQYYNRSQTIKNDAINALEKLECNSKCNNTSGMKLFQFIVSQALFKMTLNQKELKKNWKGNYPLIDNHVCFNVDKGGLRFLQPCFLKPFSMVHKYLHTIVANSPGIMTRPDAMMQIRSYFVFDKLRTDIKTSFEEAMDYFLKNILFLFFDSYELKENHVPIIKSYIQTNQKHITQKIYNQTIYGTFLNTMMKERIIVEKKEYMRNISRIEQEHIRSVVKSTCK